MVASHGRYDCIWPLGAVTLDCVKTVAFEGTADEMWPQTVDGRAEAAAVNAMASGSQHSKCDQPPDRALAVRVGADQLGHVADRRDLDFGLPSLAATVARSVFRAARCRPPAPAHPRESHGPCAGLLSQTRSPRFSFKMCPTLPSSAFAQHGMSCRQQRLFTMSFSLHCPAEVRHRQSISARDRS